MELAAKNLLEAAFNVRGIDGRAESGNYGGLEFGHDAFCSQSFIIGRRLLIWMMTLLARRAAVARPPCHDPALLRRFGPP